MCRYSLFFLFIPFPELSSNVAGMFTRTTVFPCFLGYVGSSLVLCITLNHSSSFVRSLTHPIKASEKFQAALVLRPPLPFLSPSLSPLLSSPIPFPFSTPPLHFPPPPSPLYFSPLFLPFFWAHLSPKQNRRSGEHSKLPSGVGAKHQLRNDLVYKPIRAKKSRSGGNSFVDFCKNKLGTKVLVCSKTNYQQNQQS